MSSFDRFLESFLAQSKTNRKLFLQDFLSLLTENEVKMLMRKIQELAPGERKKTSKQIQQVIAVEEGRNVIRDLSKIKQDGAMSREDQLQRVGLYAHSAARLTKSNIALNKRMVVHVGFAGLGSEHLGNHPAIVWYAGSAYGDRVVVIPCTSYKPTVTVENNSDIKIGRAKFFAGDHSILDEMEKETVVLLDQIQVVSRKRIDNYMSLSPRTNTYKVARIDEEQTRRIEEGLRVLYLGEKTLYDLYIKPYHTKTQLLEFPTTTMVPEFPHPEIQFRHLYRIPVDVQEHGCFISYRVEDDPCTYYMFRRPVVLSEKERNELLKNWVFPKKAKKEGQTISDVRDQAYRNLLLKKDASLYPAEVSTLA